MLVSDMGEMGGRRRGYGGRWHTGLLAPWLNGKMARNQTANEGFHILAN